MLRKFHSFSGLIAGLFVVVLALSGAVLSLDPALERAGVDAGAEGQSLASLAAMVQAQIPGVERIDRRANGAVVVGYATPDSMGSVIIDPTSGAILAEDAPSGMMAWVKSLHRSFLLDHAGRAA
ncbi:MAG: PepSY-associated TM helix domain-containing protein, partial [Paracoccaceae bacterium]|nr:PepSY-associated TM helix domain-containing protein [Paracoccaceae bacterium]